LDSSPCGQLAEINLRGNHGSDYHHPTSSPFYPTSTSSNPFCVKTNGRPPKISTKGIQTAFKAIKTLFYGQLSAYVNNTLRYLWSVYAGEIDLTNPDGCISNTTPNKGLKEPTSFVETLLEPLWQKYCDLISRGDFWALIGKLSVEKSDPTGTINIPYYYGRVDKADCILSDAKNPLPTPFALLNTPTPLGASLVQRFVNCMGLTVNDIGIIIVCVT